MCSKLTELEESNDGTLVRKVFSHSFRPALFLDRDGVINVEKTMYTKLKTSNL